jgi:membrane protease YdiL (CAAX protease family)
VLTGRRSTTGQPKSPHVSGPSEQQMVSTLQPSGVDLAAGAREGPGLRSSSAVVLLLFAVVIAWPIAMSVVTEAGWPVRLAVHVSPFVVILGALVAAARLEGRRLSGVLGWSTEHLGRQVLIGLALVTVTLSLVLVPALLGYSVLGDGETRPLVFLYLAVRTFLLVGFVEELAWRGYVLGGAERALGSAPWAVVVSSALFGLWHFPGGHSLVQVVVTGFIGAIYATARLKVRHCSTLATGIAHGSHDLVLLVLATLSA